MNAVLYCITTTLTEQETRSKRLWARGGCEHLWLKVVCCILYTVTCVYTVYTVFTDSNTDIPQTASDSSLLTCAVNMFLLSALRFFLLTLGSIGSSIFSIASSFNPMNIILILITIINITRRPAMKANFCCCECVFYWQTPFFLSS